MKSIKKILLLIALLVSASNLKAYDFEVDGIYYNKIGIETNLNADNNIVEVTYKYRPTYYEPADFYSDDVYLPPTVKYKGKTYRVISIGNEAFSGCRDLQSVTIPNSVTSIGVEAFSGCKNLKSVTIPNSVTSIEDGTFQYSYSLTSVTIPNSVTSIGADAFRGCSGLTSISIGNSVTSIGNSAFEDCGGLTSITIPNSVISIGESTFGFCSGLSSITIPNSVTTIGRAAFYGCSGLTSVTIGNGVISIGEYAFYSCIGLTKVEISDLSSWCKINFHDVYSNPLSYAHHLYLNGEEIKDLMIPYGLKEIKLVSFHGCKGLTSVKIPNSVIYIGGSAFGYCTNLTSVNISNSVTSIGNSAFYECSSMTSLTIPNNVTSIGENAFYKCSGMSSISIGNGVTSIGENAFIDCNGLTRVDISDLSSWCKINFHDVYSNPLSYAHHLYLNGEEIKDLMIPYGLKEIKLVSFHGCKGLTSVKIPNSVIYIGGSAFRFCDALNSVTIGTGTSYIGSYAFDGCAALKTINCFAVTPPEIYINSFSDFSADLHVPKDSKDDYQLTSYWYLFNNMTDDLNPSDGVEEIDSDISDEPMEIFDMRGVKVGVSTEELTPGFYIVKQGGNVKKISIR